MGFRDLKFCWPTLAAAKHNKFMDTAVENVDYDNLKISVNGVKCLLKFVDDIPPGSGPAHTYEEMLAEMRTDRWDAGA